MPGTSATFGGSGRFTCICLLAISHTPEHPLTYRALVCCCWLPPPQVDTLRSQVSQLEVSAAAAEAEYSRQLARNKEELAGLRSTRGTELQAMLVRESGMGHTMWKKACCLPVLWAGPAILACKERG